METINQQFDKVSYLLNNTKEFKNDNFELIAIDSKGIVFADKEFNKHFLIPRKGKSFDTEKIEIIKEF